MPHAKFRHFKICLAFVYLKITFFLKKKKKGPAMAHNPRKLTHQLGVEVGNAFFSNFIHGKCRWLEGYFESLSFDS
jgi:hypothetical protein